MQSISTIDELSTRSKYLKTTVLTTLLKNSRLKKNQKFRKRLSFEVYLFSIANCLLCKHRTNFLAKIFQNVRF